MRYDVAWRDLACDVCGGVRPFAQPECSDGHGAECPEWFCTACGTAVLLDPPRWVPVADVRRFRAA